MGGRPTEEEPMGGRPTEEEPMGGRPVASKAVADPFPAGATAEKEPHR